MKSVVEYLNRSPNGFLDLAETLELDDHQNDQIKEIRISLVKRVGVIHSHIHQGLISKRQSLEQIGQLREQADEALYRILTDSQKEKLKELVGE